MDVASSRTSVSARVWSPPQRGFYKLNIDGSWISLGDAGAGGIIRCNKGKWHIGFSMQIKTLEPASAELLAIMEGLNTAWERGTGFLELETDAQALTYMIQNPLYYNHHLLSNIIRDVSELLQKDWQVTVLRVKRIANKIAHGLADIGRNSQQDDLVLL
uniref:RNase H type-1 domain-containing protein n=1 Tax=Chenopodium quinoa TaxID=63459 RepID=A0A803MSZ0_CHEQI